MTRLKILFTSNSDINDPMAMSGIPYHMRRALEEQGHEVEVYSKASMKVMQIGRIILQLAQIVSRRNQSRTATRRTSSILPTQTEGTQINRSPRFKQKMPYLLNSYTSQLFRHDLQKYVVRRQYDFVFVAFGHAIAAQLRSSCPIIYASDTTFALISKYYPPDDNASAELNQKNNDLENQALANARFVVFSSDWAACSAVNDYGCSEDKIHVVPFGANLVVIPDSDSVSRRIQDQSDSTSCRLLFVGKDWRRKGGDIALDAVMALRTSGIDATITYVGCVPPDDAQREGVTFISSLNKNIPAEEERLTQLYMQSNFFLMPTRADCTPIVFSEASAFGLPVITTDTGGVSSTVKEGVSGFLLPEDAQGDQYAEVIARYHHDKKAYQELATNTRAYFESCLNWNSWGKSVTEIMSRDQQALTVIEDSF